MVPSVGHHHPQTLRTNPNFSIWHSGPQSSRLCLPSSPCSCLFALKLLPSALFLSPSLPAFLHLIIPASLVRFRVDVTLCPASHPQPPHTLLSMFPPLMKCMTFLLKCLFASVFLSLTHIVLARQQNVAVKRPNSESLSQAPWLNFQCTLNKMI